MLQRTLDRTTFAGESAYSVDLLLRNIESAVTSEETCTVMFSNTLRDMWVGEMAPDMANPDAVVDILVESGSILCPEMEARTTRKLANLHRALHLPHASTIDVDVVRHVHRIVMEGLLEDAGTFRTTQVGARGSAVHYARPSCIAERLAELLAFVAEASTTSTTIEHRLRLGAVFYSEFLLIHPFLNGNGRTARILLLHVLQPMIPFPFTLTSSTRDEYLEALERRSDLSPPSHLAALLLRSCNRAAATLHWLNPHHDT